MIYASLKALAGIALVLNTGTDAFLPAKSTQKKLSQSTSVKIPNILSTALSKASLEMAVTDAPVKFDTGFSGQGGMFTNSSPESRRVIPANLEGKTKFKVVYVVLESQYQSSLTKACNAINSGKEGVAIEAVGYLLEELRDAATFEKFKEDVGDANIFIGSLIFVQELADKVLHTLFYIFFFAIKRL